MCRYLSTNHIHFDFRVALIFSTDMSWQDCFVLGQQLFEMEDYNNTKVWLRESMERLRRHQPQPSAPEPALLNNMEMVAQSLFRMGEQPAKPSANFMHIYQAIFRRL